MSDSEEKPYSTIFASLNHPVRRKILRMLSQKPMSFSEILEALGVSSSFLTYHIENLGELVSKTDDGKYRLSSFGEAAIATMTKVEDIPRNMPSQNGNFRKFAPKSSIAARIITHVYILALVVSVILAGLYYVNYTSSPWTSLSTGFLVSLIASPGQNYSFYIVIDDRPMASYLYPNDSYGLMLAYRFDENHTYWAAGPPIEKTLTHWQVESVHFLLHPNVTIKFSRTFVSNETNETETDQNSRYIVLGPGSISSDMDITEVTQPSLYEIVVTNMDTLDMNETLEFQVVWQWFDKPYFYYGVAGLLVVLLYPVIMLASRLLGKRHIPD